MPGVRFPRRAIYYPCVLCDNEDMIYLLEGTTALLREQFAVVTTGGVGFKVFLSPRARAHVREGAEVKLFCHFYLREDAASLYGFLSEEELQMFEMLLGVSGIGPKSALGALGVAPLGNLRAAIKEGKAELLTKVSGIGRKSAERIILELRGKIGDSGAEGLVATMEFDSDIEDALLNLGYQKSEVRNALQKVDPALGGLEERLKAALKLLKK